MRAGRFAAVDLGASSGRVVVGDVGADGISLRGVHRFPNRPVRTPDGLHWDVLSLFASTLVGLREAGRVDSIGIDTWAVDYGLLDGDGALLGNPYCYRDSRTDGVSDLVHVERPHAELFACNGLQHLPFTTLYQLASARGSAQLAAARTLLLLPDLLVHWLTGSVGAELTNASTTGLLSARTRNWDAALCAVAGVDPALLPPLRCPGDRLGTLLPEVVEATSLTPSTPVVAVGSHDTASAVVAVPMDARSAAYVSLGTWGLVGVEVPQPLLGEEARRAGFTNEIGVDGRIRFLRNVMGMWLLEECQRVWGTRDIAGLLQQAEAAGPQPQFDLQDPAFLPPGDMPTRIRAATGAPLPERGEVVRAIVDSLVAEIARTVREAARISAVPVEQVHVVGGGSQNDLLCRLLARELGVAVVAGPVEATAMGNLLVQARSAGVLSGELEELRELVARTSALVTYRPRT